MPFIPHTKDDVAAMLATIGVERIDDLFDEIPETLRAGQLDALAPGMAEFEIERLMRTRAHADGQPLCFIGAGAYQHHIPAAVWQLVGRGEFYSAYTPYQAEASQGTLQVLYEFQSMMATLTGLDVANASLYDGASALAEAILMAVRANRANKSSRVLIPQTLHPLYRKVAHDIVALQGIDLVEIALDPATGRTDIAALDAALADGCVALAIAQPNFFGALEDVHTLTDRAHAHQALAIGVVNPLALALLAPPGDWGAAGADIACGEAQPLGMPLSSGGPYAGFLCCKQQFVRQLPGRIAGRTVDLDGQPGFALTLQAREQHIRRGKATSNICTNQGLLATAATIHMALLGPTGLERVAAHCHANTQRLTELLSAIPGVEPLFDGPVFHERVLRLPCPAAEVLTALARQNILGGYDLATDYPQLGNALLVCATELRTEDEMAHFATQLRQALDPALRSSSPAA